jgi:hypothetical protein
MWALCPRKKLKRHAVAAKDPRCAPESTNRAKPLDFRIQPLTDLKPDISVQSLPEFIRLGFP